MVNALVLDLGDELRASRAALQADFEHHHNATRVLHRHTGIVDRCLRRLWRASAMPHHCALVAVGGYGRGELYPGSDVDLLLLVDASDAAERAAERLIGQIFDLGLDIGHAVRNCDECVVQANNDISVSTSQLESRQLAGNRRLYAEFHRRTREVLDPREFFKAKRLEQEQRHSRHQDTAYSLEPNLKEAPGGLRDLHVILWIARAAGLAHRWQDLARGEFVTPAEARQLVRHLRLLQSLRVRLHYLARRREDRLLFDLQTALAGKLGITGDGHRRAGELLMQRYYRTAKSVMQLNTILLQNLGAAIFPMTQAPPQLLNERFQVRRELLDAREADIFEREPAAIFEGFVILQENAALRGMTARTLRALWRARHRIDAGFRRDPCNRRRFVAMLSAPSGVVHGLRRMNQTGVLGRYLPVFGRIVGQMQHDLFHVYTVDQHILTVVRNLRRFTMPEYSHEHPLCSRLMSGFDQPWLLYVAGLFHDIAKGRGGDHSQLGKRDVLRFARDHEIVAADAALLGFLVEHHLTMSSIAQKKDLGDPSVIRAFADLVRDERRLVALYLLTVADIRGTSPKVWNAWKGKLLEDLYRLAHRAIQGGNIEIAHGVEEKQAKARDILRHYALAEGSADKLWQVLDVAYFLRHDAREIAWHVRTLFYRVGGEPPVVKARMSPVGEGLQVMIYTRDQPLLFARICGFFERLNLSIASANIHTTRHGYALDSFQVMDSTSNPDYRAMIPLVEHELAARLEHQPPLDPPRTGRISRQQRAYPITPNVELHPDERGSFHLLSIIAGDRPGLLHGVAHVLGNYHIVLHTARINTLGARAEDVFLISGEALQRPVTVVQMESELLKFLAG